MSAINLAFKAFVTEKVQDQRDLVDFSLTLSRVSHHMKGIFANQLLGREGRNCIKLLNQCRDIIREGQLDESQMKNVRANAKRIFDKMVTVDSQLSSKEEEELTELGNEMDLFPVGFSAHKSEDIQLHSQVMYDLEKGAERIFGPANVFAGIYRLAPMEWKNQWKRANPAASEEAAEGAFYRDLKNLKVMLPPDAIPRLRASKVEENIEKLKSLLQATGKSLTPDRERQLFREFADEDDGGNQRIKNLKETVAEFRKTNSGDIVATYKQNHPQDRRADAEILEDLHFGRIRLF